MAKIKIYQANIGWNNKFMSYNFIMKHGGIDQSEYNCVFDGYVGTDDLEDIFTIFNTRKVDGFTGHSLSVSDIVVIQGEGAYIVDSFGFVKVCDWMEV